MEEQPQTMNTRKMKKSSKDKRGHYTKSTMNNLKSRLSSAYKNETGRSFQNDFSEVNEELAEKLDNVVRDTKDDPKSLTPVEGLSHLLDRDWSVRDWNSTEALVNSAAGYKLLPKYKSLLEAKKDLIPPFEVAEDGKDVIVPLQPLVYLDVTQILDDPQVKAAVMVLVEEAGGHLEVKYYIKLGLDGMSGLDLFNYPGEPGTGHCLTSMMTGLQIVTTINGRTRPIFTSPFFNSPSGCRPLRLWGVKETTGEGGTLQVEIGRLQGELDNLAPLHYSDQITVHFSGKISGADGKVIMELTGCISTQRCPLCHLLPRQYKGIREYPYLSPEAAEHLSFANLHFGLRLFEHLQRLAALQDLKTYRCGPQHPLYRQFQANEERIKEEFIIHKGNFWKKKLKPPLFVLNLAPLVFYLKKK